MPGSLLRIHASFGNVNHRLPKLQGVLAAEGAMFDRINKVLGGPVTQDLQTSAFNCDIDIACVERPDKHNLLRTLADVDEAARTRKLREKSDVNPPPP